MFPCEFWEIFDNTFFTEYLLAIASLLMTFVVSTLGFCSNCLLSISSSKMLWHLIQHYCPEGLLKTRCIRKPKFLTVKGTSGKNFQWTCLRNWSYVNWRVSEYATRYAVLLLKTYYQNSIMKYAPVIILRETLPFKTSQDCRCWLISNAHCYVV